MTNSDTHNPSDFDEQATRAAWLYYDCQLNQSDVARRLAVSRSTVSRLLKHARSEGIVRITVTQRPRESAELETALKALGLHPVQVEPQDVGERAIDACARAGSRLLSSLVHDHVEALGVGWGSTLGAAANLVRREQIDGLQLVDIVGRPPGDGPFVAACDLLTRSWLASRTAIPAPAFSNSPRTVAALTRDPVVKAALDRARSIEIMLVSVGGIDADATLVKAGIVTAPKLRALRRRGAVGDLLCHFYDRAGAEIAAPGVPAPLGLSLDDLRDRHVIAFACGPTKVEPLRAGIDAGLINGLATDATTAHAVLDL